MYEYYRLHIHTSQNNNLSNYLMTLTGIFAKPFGRHTSIGIMGPDIA